MKTLLLFLSLCFCMPALTAQPAIQWQSIFGGSEADIAYSIKQTSDGGYIVAGTAGSSNGYVYGNHGNYDVWVIKLNPSGIPQWTRALGGTTSEDARSVCQTIDGGYILAGRTYSNDGDVLGNHGSSDFWVVKLDNLGTLQWQKTLGGNEGDEAHCVQQTSDGGYIVAGNVGNIPGSHGASDAWVIKLGNTGDIQWQKVFGGSNYDGADFIQQTTDGGYIMTGFTNSNDGDVTESHGQGDMWVVKLNDTAAIQWQKALGGTKRDDAYSIQQTTDEGYIVAGHTYSNDGDVSGSHGGNDAWVVKLTDAGIVQWQKALGGSTNDNINAIQQTTDGGYVAVGSTYSNDGDVSGNHGLSADAWIVKLSDAGELQWQKALGGSQDDNLISILQAGDGSYVMAGYTGSNNGDVFGNHGFLDCWVIKLPAGFVGVENTPVAMQEDLLQVFPNPAYQEICIKIAAEEALLHEYS